MRGWMLAIAVMLIVAGCGSTTPGDDSDPTGAYHFSHSRVYGQLMIPEVVMSRAGAA